MHTQIPELGIHRETLNPKASETQTRQDWGSPQNQPLTNFKTQRTKRTKRVGGTTHKAHRVSKRKTQFKHTAGFKTQSAPKTHTTQAKRKTQSKHASTFRTHPCRRWRQQTLATTNAVAAISIYTQCMLQPPQLPIPCMSLPCAFPKRNQNAKPSFKTRVETQSTRNAITTQCNHSTTYVDRNARHRTAKLSQRAL